MNNYLTQQGEVTIKGVKLFQPIVEKTMRITKIVFNNINSVPYIVELYRYNYDSGQNIFLLNKFELNAGDSVQDHTVYLIDSRDYLFAKTNVEGTIYVLEGQYD